jgi:hypothetical protein
MLGQRKKKAIQIILRIVKNDIVGFVSSIIFFNRYDWTLVKFADDMLLKDC